jgi:hypothetical protein
VAGTLQLGAPLVSKWRAPEALRAAAIERGLAPGVFDGVLKRVFEERLEEYVIAQSPGNEVPFRAELTYLETVDGTDLGGRVDYDPGPGQPIDSVAGSYAYVVGDARFDRWVGEILAVGMPVQDAAGLALRSFFADYASGGLAMYRDGARILESGPITPLATPERLLNYGRVGSRIGEEGLFLRLSVPMRATAEMATRGPRNFAEAFVPGGPPSNVVASIAVPWGGAQLSDMAMAIFIPTGDGRESRYSDELYFDPASQLFSRIAFGGTLWAYGR